MGDLCRAKARLDGLSTNGRVLRGVHTGPDSKAVHQGGLLVPHVRSFLTLYPLPAWCHRLLKPHPYPLLLSKSVLVFCAQPKLISQQHLHTYIHTYIRLMYWMLLCARHCIEGFAYRLNLSLQFSVVNTVIFSFLQMRKQTESKKLSQTHMAQC